MSKRNYKHMLLAAVMAVLVLASACGGTANNAPKQGANGPSTNGESNQGAAEGSNGTSGDGAGNTGESEAAIDPMGKYDPPIELSTVVISDPTMNFENGDTFDNNPYYRAYGEQLGIKMSNLWVVDQSQREQKMNLAITSGDLPDIMHVNANQLQLLYKAGRLADLTEVYDQYVLPSVKDFLTVDGGHNLQSGMFDGKLYAIPETQSYLDGAVVLWVRTDWLNKLKLPEPQSMEDVLNIAKAFTADDPDGNSKPDTFGLALTKDIFAGYAGAEGFFYGYGAYPEAWLADASGKLIPGNIQPEVKAALAELQALYKAGVIDQEFGVKDLWKASEAAVAGKNGLFFGTMANTFQLQPGIEQDPEMEWKAYPVAALGGGIADVLRSRVTNTGYYVVSSKSKHPEAAMKLLNFFVESQFGAEPIPALAEDAVAWKLSVFRPFPAAKNYENFLAVRDALASGDSSKLNPEQEGVMKHITEVQSGNKKDNNWAMAKVFGAESSYAAIDQYVVNDRFTFNEFYGSPTPTMQAKGSALSKLTTETFTKIITGRASIDEFDAYVDKWQAMGGVDITNEINEWYAGKGN